MLTAKLATLGRSTIVGGAATLTDLLVLFVCMHAFGWSPRVANVPALIAGGVVNFHGNRTFAFRATEGRIERQATLFLLSELVTLALNGVLYDLAIRSLHPQPAGAMVIRLITQNVVFLAWSFPVWRLVFRR
ncbi:MAG: GtrA family protein [Deltaproteobacteria bacterium]|nr:GtrA family protein [Deltaproteobacteria bacterium]